MSGNRAFVMSYFRTRKEALHVAISHDGYDWSALNRNRPILSSTLGTRTMRDPFIFRDRDDRFHLLATDGWTSQYIIHAISEDLIRWEKMSAVPVMVGVAGARNSWAPEAFYDAEERIYRVIWSSSVLPDEPGDARDHRIWSAPTEDFITFGPPELFFDPGFSAIDATVFRKDDLYLMAFKDERGSNKPDTMHKAIRLCESRGDCRSFGTVSGIVTPPLTEGPILFRCHGRWMLFYDCFMAGQWGASVSVDLVNWVDVTRGVRFPTGPRHGSVLEVEYAVIDRLERLL